MSILMDASMWRIPTRQDIETKKFFYINCINVPRVFSHNIIIIKDFNVRKISILQRRTDFLNKIGKISNGCL